LDGSFGFRTRHQGQANDDVLDVHMETSYGRSPGEIVTLAKNLADRVAKGLSCKHGCVLGEGQINKRHELGVDDPVANLLNRYFTVSTPKLVIDDSLGDDEGELDHIERDTTVEYLLMPERVKELEGQVGNVLYDLEKIAGSLTRLERMGYNLERVADILCKILDFEAGSDVAKASVEGGNSYVSKFGYGFFISLIFKYTRVCTFLWVLPMCMLGFGSCLLSVSLIV
jgi:hypothetical protein